MNLKKLGALGFFLAVALFSYTTSNAQIVDKVKDAASVTKDATVKAAKKTADVTKDAASKTKDVTVDTWDKTEDTTMDVADKTKNATVKTAKVGASTATRVGDFTVSITEGVTGEAPKQGKYYTTTVWDGKKWVSKSVFYPTKTQ